MTTMRPPFQLTLDLPILAGVKPRVRPCERSKWPRRCPNPKARHPRVLNPPNRRGTDPYARWCGRGGVVRRPPIPIEGHPPPCDAGGRRGPRSRFRFPLSIQAREAEVGSPSKSVTAFPSIIAMPLRVTLHHHLRQLVLDLPGRGLRHPEAAAEFDAGDALLALGQVIHGAEPKAQRQVGRGEDRACDRRGLAATGVTLEQPTGLHLAICAAAAGRTFEAIRPSGGDHHRPAFLLGAVDRLEGRLTEALLKLHFVPSHCRTLPDFMFTLCTMPERLRKVRKQERLKPSSVIVITDCTLPLVSTVAWLRSCSGTNWGTVSVRSPRMRQTSLATIHLRPPLANTWTGDGLMPLTLKVTLVVAWIAVEGMMPLTPRVEQDDHNDLLGSVGSRRSRATGRRGRWGARRPRFAQIPTRRCRPARWRYGWLRGRLRPFLGGQNNSATRDNRAYHAMGHD